MTETLENPIWKKILDEMIKLINHSDSMEVPFARKAAYCHSEDERMIKIVDRSDIIKKICYLWELRQSALINGTFDRSHYILPVCTGIPGVGKTRMLEEFGKIFNEMKPPIKSNILGIQILYFNGHSPQKIDYEYSIEKSFCWRLLHRYFLEGLVEYKSFMEKLPLFPLLDELTLVNVIRAICCHFSSNSTTYVSTIPISIFIGVDEYQSISLFGNEEIIDRDRRDKEELCLTKLQKLVLLLFESAQSLTMFKIHLYTMFAGTEWCQLSGVGSANLAIQRIVIPFMTQGGFCSIASNIYPEGLNSEVFKNCLFSIGDIARSVVEFTKQMKRAVEKNGQPLRANRIVMIRDNIDLSNNQQWIQLLPRLSLLRLVAFSLSGLCIDPSDIPTPAIEMNNQQQLRWNQLADRGLLHIVNDGLSKYKVLIPNVAMRKCASYYNLMNLDIIKGSSREATIEFAFLQSLDAILHVSIRNDMEPWQLWEQFGALYHCLRINSLLLLGHESAPLSVIFDGSNSHYQTLNYRVMLSPAYLFRSEEPLGADLDLTTVSEKDNILCTLNLLNDDDIHVVLNATNGKSADIFILFRTVAGSIHPYLLFIDQRKRDSVSVTTNLVNKFHDEMLQLQPTTVGNECIIVTGLFSALSGYGKREVIIPKHCIVFTRDELKPYHCSLSSHFAANALFNPNLCNKTLLIDILGGNKEAKIIANHIVELRKSQFFYSLTELNNALISQKSCTISEEFRTLLFFLFSDDTDDEIISDNINNEDEDLGDKLDDDSLHPTKKMCL